MHRPFRRRVVSLVLGLSALGAPAAPQDAAAPFAGEVEELRRELESLRREYAERLAALEARLEALEPGKTQAAAAPPPELVPPPAQVVAPAPAGPPPPGALPAYGAVTPSSKIFNPDIALIGDFLGAAGQTAEGGEPSLEMHEAEASFQAIVDPYARADFFLTFGPGEVGIEEAFVTFPALPGGLLLKVGKLRDAFGKVNAMHNHVLSWTDRPLVTRNLLGGEEGLSDSGVSLSRLIPNPWLFLEATAQVYQGNSEIFAAPRPRDLGYVGHLRAYQDLSESTNLDLGGSFAWGHNDAGPDRTTRIFGVDASFRYRPLRRAIYKRLLARSELVWSRRQDTDGERAAFGMYASVEYQLARRWFAGARYDHAERASDPTLVDKGGSLLLTYWPSEFGQVRSQFRRTRLGEGSTHNEFLFQFLFSIGAHGAHAF